MIGRSPLFFQKLVFSVIKLELKSNAVNTVRNELYQYQYFSTRYQYSILLQILDKCFQKNQNDGKFKKSVVHIFYQRNLKYGVEFFRSLFGFQFTWILLKFVEEFFSQQNQSSRWRWCKSYSKPNCFFLFTFNFLSHLFFTFMAKELEKLTGNNFWY
jgi:hypothetical protein